MNSRELVQKALNFEKPERAPRQPGMNLHDFDTESADRQDMKLPYGQDDLIKKLLQINPNIIIVNMSGSQVEMGEWLEDMKSYNTGIQVQKAEQHLLKCCSAR